MQAVLQAVHLIESGMAAVVVAGGMENMSRAPFLLPRAREGYRLGHQQVIDSLIADGLWDPYNDLHMGSCAERCASKLASCRFQTRTRLVSSTWISLPLRTAALAG